MSIFIYIGGAPKNGKCSVFPLSGIATITKFNITQKSWEDNVPISKYEYFYSYDNGKIYLPIETEIWTEKSILKIFNPIYNKYNEIILICKATN